MGRGKEGRNWKFVSHKPQWVAAPLRIDREGNTKPGYLCIHDLENGNGLCAGTSFDQATREHTCVVRLRGKWNISRPCYDKHRRCPGWAGGGWKGAKYTFCREKDGYSGYLDIDYESKWWKWKTHKCSNCGVTVLPYMVRWTSPYSYWLSVRFARNSWWWLIKLETKIGKWRGRW